MNHDDLPETAEHRGPQVGTSARRWQTAGWLLVALFLVSMLFCARRAHAQDTTWTFGGFADAGYLFAPNDPYNQVFRSRGTAWHVNDPYLNMAVLYAKRPATAASRLGFEATAQGGKDAEIFGFSATAPNMAGADWLRYLGPTNVSYLADVGKGLTIQGGIFSSLIGYDALYARDNLLYTRPWGADFTPYLMLGGSVSYPATDKLTVTGILVNGYWHLAHANSVPSVGGQLAYVATPKVTIKQAVLAGPHQSDTSFGYWRVISDSIVEHKTDRFVIAFNGHFATEAVADAAAPVRAWWMAAQLPMQWHVGGPWRLSIRPEVAWDSVGRWTLAEQTVKAFTGAVEYRPSFKDGSLSLRFEYRVDNSTGPQGGFFTDREDELIATQHLLIGAAVIRFDRSR